MTAVTLRAVTAVTTVTYSAVTVVTSDKDLCQLVRRRAAAVPS